jgi:pimeloyl-ACP methyl ester carboxylesterase
VHYRDTGSGIPLILLHQSPHSSKMFTAAYDLLAARGVRAIGMDTPGFGMSDVPDPRPSIETYASVIPSLMDGLGIDRCTVLGHHTGASIAIEFALNHPERLKGVILNGPPIYDEEKKAASLARAERHGPVPEADGSHFLRSWQRRVNATPGWSNLKAMHRSVVDTLSNGDTAWYGHIAAYEHDTLGKFQKIAGPALIFTNTGDDVYSWAKRAHELRPDFEYAELEGGTHDIVDEQPEAWSDVVAGYVHKMANA